MASSAGSIRSFSLPSSSAACGGEKAHKAQGSAQIVRKPGNPASRDPTDTLRLGRKSARALQARDALFLVGGNEPLQREREVGRRRGAMTSRSAREPCCKSARRKARMGYSHLSPWSSWMQITPHGANHLSRNHTTRACRGLERRTRSSLDSRLSERVSPRDRTSRIAELPLGVLALGRDRTHHHRVGVARRSARVDSRLCLAKPRIFDSRASSRRESEPTSPPHTFPRSGDSVCVSHFFTSRAHLAANCGSHRSVSEGRLPKLSHAGPERASTHR